ncbi:MAG: hypothetical protein HUJ72_06915 [Blautia sp.]|nr:hypothetical protein [Blautia sp.]
MRIEKFKMERPGLVSIGQQVEITEIETANYSYIIEPAVAMSGVFKPNNRIKSKTGIIKEIQETPRGYYVLAEFDE